MSEKQSIGDDVAEWISGFISGNGFGDDYVDAETKQWADDLLASPVIRRVRAEAIRGFAAELDHYIGTILNAESASNLAHARADRIERGDL